ncbi:MAG: hypothetical protein H0U74_03255 [Bradymonadaceae bacterium]|nr:hypothetical protein [Lujinxingiaceae bacterium]
MLCLLGACSGNADVEPAFQFEEPIDDVASFDADPGDLSEPDRGHQHEEEVAVVIPSRGAVDGEPCKQDVDCRGGTCINAPDWQDGYCTTMNCIDLESCATDYQDNRCFRGSEPNFCVRMCQVDGDCRDGYICTRVGFRTSFCAPDTTPRIDLDALENLPFELSCTPSEGGTVEFSYAIAPETLAYMVTPISRDGRRLRPSHVTTPSGATINFQTTNAFQTVPSQLFGSMNPTVVPAIGRFADQLESGEHTYHLRTEANEVCHYLLEESTPGTTIDLNVYLVGVHGVTAISAEENASIQRVLSQFAAIYESAAIRLGEVNFHDISGDDALRFSVIRSQTEVMQLVALSRQPEGDLSRSLSANIFFVRQFAFSDGGGAIGISLGLPGAAGLHGSPVSGVVFTSEYMGTAFEERDGSVVDGDDFTGVVLAHELGHYLGLFHTSEHFSQGFDPLEDTPECRSGFPSRCPDLGNLMFPLASVTHTNLTDDQAWVVRVNPLTKD